MIENLLIGKLGVLGITALLGTFPLTSSPTPLSPRPLTVSPNTFSSSLSIRDSSPERSSAPAADACRPQEQGRVIVETSGSFGRLVDGTVQIVRDGQVVAEGRPYQSLEVPVGCDLDLRVTLTGLVDQPVVTVRAPELRSAGQLRRVPVSVETGLVRVQAYRDDRRVAGVARFYRGLTTPSSGSVGANGASREISTGRWQVRLRSGGVTLTDEVSVAAGSVRLARLER